MNSSQLSVTDYPAYFSTYINAVGNVDLIEELEISVHRLIKFIQNIPMGKHDYSYAEGKWTIKDIIQHLIDAERIFSYRALRFARNDKTELPGFEENDYAAIANGSQRTLIDLLSELAVVRQSTLALFKSFNEEILSRKGIASNKAVTVAAIGFVIIGHQNHHQRIFQERYLD